MNDMTGGNGFGGCGESPTLDPHKRVHYTEGLVLGVDEFVQEEFYFLEAARRHHRTLHGYGTVCGLAVDVVEKDGEFEVRVEPGQAIDAMGRELHVGTAQCARLNDWLAREAGRTSPPLTPPGPVNAWVVLCYRQCRTDQEPIPGGPCRTPEEALTPTRVTESFSLRLDLSQPTQLEYDTVCAFARLLVRLDIIPSGIADISPEDLVAGIRALAPRRADEPPLPPSPLPTGRIRIPEAEIEKFLNRAFHAWVTYVRPRLVPQDRGCAQGPGGEGCIALACLEFPVADAGGSLVVDTSVASPDDKPVKIKESERPLLLHSQLIQKLLVTGSASGPDVGVVNHDELSGLDDDDHPHYLLVQPRTDPPGGEDILVNHLSGNDTFKIRGLPEATQLGEAMPAGQTAGGDLLGRLPDPTVVQLHDKPLQAPVNGDIGKLVAVGGSPNNLTWQLVDPPTPGGDGGEEGLVRIFALSWVHNAGSNLNFTLELQDGSARTVPGLAVAFGRKAANDAVVLLGVEGSGTERRIDLGSLDVHSFRVYAEQVIDQPTTTGQRLRLIPQDLVPIEPKVEEGADLFEAGTSLSEAAAPGALLIFDSATQDLVVSNQMLIWIEIDGDHVMSRGLERDEPLRAIDAEFLRSDMPTGDRRVESERGTQGGLFSSWINRANPEGLAGSLLDVNRASFGALRAAGVTAPAARALVLARQDRGGFGNVTELQGIQGVGAQTVQLLSNRNQFFFGPR